VSWGENSLKVLPADAEPRVVAKALSRDFPGTQTAPIESVVQFARPAASSAAARSGELAAYASRLAGISGVQAARLTGVRDGIALMELRYRYDPISAAARRIVQEARDRAARGRPRIHRWQRITGQPSGTEDARTIRD
jgi:uncharacterized membrane protein YdfJ with MMPL/SSD domain